MTISYAHRESYSTFFDEIFFYIIILPIDKLTNGSIITTVRKRGGIMNRKEEIIYATLELASEYGLKSVSLSQIADKVGIRKPSLYNHFKSKEELVKSMYTFLREKAKISVGTAAQADVFPEDKSLALILSDSISVYFSFLSDENMMKFFKVLYSERSISPVAAQIMLDETERMISMTKNLFYALVVHGKMKNEHVDTAALSFAMTVHSLVDRQMDMITAGLSEATATAELPKEIVQAFKEKCLHDGVSQASVILAAIEKFLAE